MSEQAKQGGASGDGTTGADALWNTLGMSQSSWEARLAVARAKREKVLEARGDSATGPHSNWEERLAVERSEREKNLKAEENPTIPQLRFSESETAANFDKPRVDSTAQEHAEWIIEKDRRDDFSFPEGTAGQFVEYNQATQSEKHTQVTRNRISASLIVSVAFACFFGLGFGMVLSFAGVFAMGWVSVNKISPEQSAVGPLDNKVAPYTDATLVAGMTSGFSEASESRFSHSAIAPIKIAALNRPELFVATAADESPAVAQPPAPRFVSSGGIDEFVPQLNFQSATIGVNFETPEVFATTPVLLEAGRETGDALPVAPKSGSINPLTELTNPNPPTLDGLAVTFASVHDLTHVRLAVPPLFVSSPGVMPRVFGEKPEKLVVFDGGVQRLAPSANVEGGSAMVASEADGPPMRASSVNALMSHDIVNRLPVVGNSVQTENNLASKLGFGENAAKRFNVVTFAPTGVSKERMASNAAKIGATGFPVAAANRVNFKVSKTHVRFYSRQDEIVARAIANEIGGFAKDFTTNRKAPPPGRVEVWLKGDKKVLRSAIKPKRAVRKTQSQAALKSQLENRLVNSLRRGEHLRSPSE